MYERAELREAPLTPVLNRLELALLDLREVADPDVGERLSRDLRHLSPLSLEIFLTLAVYALLGAITLKDALRLTRELTRLDPIKELSDTKDHHQDPDERSSPSAIYIEGLLTLEALEPKPASRERAEEGEA